MNYKRGIALQLSIAVYAFILIFSILVILKFFPKFSPISSLTIYLFKTYTTIYDAFYKFLDNTCEIKSKNPVVRGIKYIICSGLKELTNIVDENVEKALKINRLKVIREKFILIEYFNYSNPKEFFDVIKDINTKIISDFSYLKLGKYIPHELEGKQAIIPLKEIIVFSDNYFDFPINLLLSQFPSNSRILFLYVKKHDKKYVIDTFYITSTFSVPLPYLIYLFNLTSESIIDDQTFILLFGSSFCSLTKLNLFKSILPGFKLDCLKENGYDIKKTFIEKYISIINKVYNVDYYYILSNPSSYINILVNLNPKLSMLPWEVTSSIIEKSIYSSDSYEAKLHLLLYLSNNSREYMYFSILDKVISDIRRKYYELHPELEPVIVDLTLSNLFINYYKMLLTPFVIPTYILGSYLKKSFFVSDYEHKVEDFIHKYIYNYEEYAKTVTLLSVLKEIYKVILLGNFVNSLRNEMKDFSNSKYFLLDKYNEIKNSLESIKFSLEEHNLANLIKDFNISENLDKVKEIINNIRRINTNNYRDLLKYYDNIQQISENLQRNLASTVKKYDLLSNISIIIENIREMIDFKIFSDFSKFYKRDLLFIILNDKDYFKQVSNCLFKSVVSLEGIAAITANVFKTALISYKKINCVLKYFSLYFYLHCNILDYLSDKISKFRVKGYFDCKYLDELKNFIESYGDFGNLIDYLKDRGYFRDINNCTLLYNYGKEPFIVCETKNFLIGFSLSYIEKRDRNPLLIMVY